MLPVFANILVSVLPRVPCIQIAGLTSLLHQSVAGPAKPDALLCRISLQDYFLSCSITMVACALLINVVHSPGQVPQYSKSMEHSQSNL